MAHTPDTNPGLLTIRETAERLHIHRGTAYRLARAGEIPTVKVGGSIRVPAKLLIDSLQRSANRAQIRLEGKQELVPRKEKS